MAGVHKKNARLGELLVDKGIATSDQIDIALTEQKEKGDYLGKILVRLGFATEAVIRDVIGGVIGQDSVDLQTVVADADAVRVIPEEMARRLHILPLIYNEARNKLSLAMTNTLDLVALDQISTYLGSDIKVEPVLAGEVEIEKAIDQFYGFDLSIDGILNEIETGEVDYKSFDTVANEYSQPVVRLVNAVLMDAVKHNSSDIHLEPEEGFLRFRYRIDGVLRQVRSLHKNYWPAICVRVKVMAGMDIAETRVPQDGRISLSVSGRPIDFRVSTLPTVHGENIVLRILERQKGVVSLKQTGLSEASQEKLKTMVARPEGIILVTGPTGSGKTTTLYSILNHLNTAEVNIMTLEDPVEYPTTMIRQTSVSEAARLNFASGIRSLMRQDPDIILVGEVRDEDTANMAFRAAMTGHQVFSTLHTNSALGSIPRLLDIGVKPNIIAGNIIGIIAQRLTRSLCFECKEAHHPSETERALLGLKATDEINIYRPKGCGQCSYQGYKGRLVLHEILSFDADIDELIARNATQRELLKLVRSKGFKTLADAGVDLILTGSSSIQEVSRVVDLSTHFRKAS